MKKLNKNQYEQLKAYEHHLDTAVHFNYVRTLPMQDALKMAQILNQITKQTTNISCPGCVFNMCKQLGKLYFDYKTSNYYE